MKTKWEEEVRRRSKKKVYHVYRNMCFSCTSNSVAFSSPPLDLHWCERGTELLLSLRDLIDTYNVFAYFLLSYVKLPMQTSFIPLSTTKVFWI